MPLRHAEQTLLIYAMSAFTLMLIYAYAAAPLRHAISRRCFRGAAVIAR